MTKPTPPKKATALAYDGDNAPTVVAQGDGDVAARIIEIAEQNDVFIHEDPILVEVLSQLELGDEIPEQLYLAVAKIIAFAYGLQEKFPE
ncbi:MAG: EscU/YscU/HrcU family type III secretion system export apparatus switch protein [Kangiellaceae bacterium]|jgi:flagellar biosynthesis protein|nr:EscU/YscU/HrcU family type III secretion system export apparatus switch protein [Kangiellaceae bacterium]